MRIMARPLRMESESGVYHVLNRAKQTEAKQTGSGFVVCGS